MSKESFISKLSKRLGEPADTSPEDIDREVTAAVEAIKSEKVDTLEGGKVLSGNDSEKGGKVYIFDLQPIYELLGGSNGRMADNLRESCQNEFAEQSVRGRDRASLEGDLFVMRFAGISEQEEFMRAANIVNTVGSALLGSRFETLEVPALLVAASAASAFNPDGSPNLDAMRAALEDGGFPVSMDDPDDDAPEWVKLRWQKEVRNFQIREQTFKAKAKEARAIRAEVDRVKRKASDRRKLAAGSPGDDRRQTFDRRGRGY